MRRYILINAAVQGIIASSKMRVSSQDSTPDFLENKVVTDGSLDITKLNPSGNESLQISLDQTTIDHNNLQNRGTKTHVQLEQDIDDINADLAKYNLSFIPSDWTLNGDYYQLSVLNSTHLKSNPFVYVLDNVGDLIDTGLNITVDGDVIISVISNPDLRFSGKLIIF